MFSIVDAFKPVIRPATTPLDKLTFFQPGELVKDFQISFLREAELKHGRLAMLASIIIPSIELFTDKLGINGVQNLPQDLQIELLCLMFLFEFKSMIIGWEHPTKKPFTLKDDYQPGDLEFGIWKENNEYTNMEMDMELNHCRLAMIGALGMIVQELVTQNQLF
jgi:hypothetical protein